jgi:hypothetical protein
MSIRKPNAHGLFSAYALNTLSLRERGGRIIVPFFWRTLPILFPDQYLLEEQQ